MKKFLINWIIPTSYERLLSSTVLLLIGMLVITNGRVGIQATPESEVSWIEAFSEIKTWVGWVIVWIAFDGVFVNGKATTFLLSITVLPVVRAILSNVLGEKRFDALMRRLEKRKKVGVRNKPLTLVEVRDLVAKSKSQILLTAKAYEGTAGSVLDYAKQRGIEVSKGIEDV